MSPPYGELRPTNGWGPSGSLRHPCKFQRVSRIGSVTARHLVVVSAKLCGVEQRSPPVFGRATITLGIGPHSSSWWKGQHSLYASFSKSVPNYDNEQKTVWWSTATLILCFTGFYNIFCINWLSHSTFGCFPRQSPFRCCLSSIWTGLRHFVIPTTNNGEQQWSKTISKC